MPKFIGRAAIVKVSGSFVSEVKQVGILLVNQVTLINNTPSSQHFDSFYEEHGENAVLFEVWKGNECRIFSDGKKLNDWLIDNANFHNENPSRSINL